MGADNFINISNWKDYEELITKYNYIVFNRSYIDLEKYISENKLISKHKDRIQIIENVNYKNCSATDIRNKIKVKSIKNSEVISKEILEYILKNNIYG